MGFEAAGFCEAGVWVAGGFAAEEGGEADDTVGGGSAFGAGGGLFGAEGFAGRGKRNLGPRATACRSPRPALPNANEEAEGE